MNEVSGVVEVITHCRLFKRNEDVVVIRVRKCKPCSSMNECSDASLPGSKLTGNNTRLEFFSGGRYGLCSTFDWDVSLLHVLSSLENRTRGARLIT